MISSLWSTTESYKRSILALCGICLVFHLMSMREGHNWGGDFSQYILHARNLVEGKAYADLGYIDVPGNPYNPQAYPPGLPYSLVPIIAAVGVNLWALKIPVVLYLVIGVWAFGRLLPYWMPRKWALGCTAFLAVSPRLLHFSNNILSDIPFLSFVIICIWAADRFFARPPDIRSSLTLILAILAASSFRTVGSILAIAVFTQALLFRRSHIRHAALVCLGSFAILSVGYTYFHCGATYFKGLSFDLPTLLGNLERNLWAYRRGLTRFLALYPSRDEASLIYVLANNPPIALFLGMAGVGIVNRVRRRGVTCDHVFAGGYLTVILLYRWNQSVRYLLPVLPILIAHAFLGLRYVSTVVLLRYRERLRGSFRIWFRRSLVPLLPALIYVPLFVAKWGYYSFVPVSVGANVFQDPDVIALFDETRTRAHEIDGVIFNRPRVLHLLTGVRAGVCYNVPDLRWDGPRLWDLAEANNISHILIGPHEMALPPIVEANPDAFVLEYENPQYTLYRMGPRNALHEEQHQLAGR